MAANFIIEGRMWLYSPRLCTIGVEEQTIDCVILCCPIHQSPHGLHGLTVLDDEAIKWLLNSKHLHQDLVQPSSGLKELAHTMKNYIVVLI